MKLIENPLEHFNGPSGLCYVCLTPMKMIEGTWKCPKGCKVNKGGIK